jgi:6-phospho-beta-glucosidase
MHDAVVEEQRHERTRAEAVLDIERALLEQYRDPNVHTKPELLAQRGGAFYSEAALQLVASLASGNGDVQVVDVRNNGTLPDLPTDAIIEVPCRVDRNGATPTTIATLPPEQDGLVANVAAYEKLAVQAAITGDRDTAFLALLTHPLISQAATAEQLLDDLLAANIEHLPQFAS